MQENGYTHRGIDDNGSLLSDKKKKWLPYAII